jgi:TonB-dependent receptor
VPAPAQPADANPNPVVTAAGIEGVVYNSTNGLPVGRAKVSAGVGVETLTDDEGRFFFRDIPAGAAQLKVSYLGFDSQTAAVTVEAGKTVTRDFQLVREGSSRSRAAGTGDDVVMLEKFEVVADQTMTSQALAMNEQRHAPNIKNVVALEDLGSFGTENIGDYIRFLPGVAILDDGDDAGQLMLGGFGPEFTNVSLDGGGVASTGAGTPSGSGDVSKRNLTLAEVPMVNIERVEVTKVPTPDMPASGLGGSMNLVTKGLLGTRRAYLDYQLYMNFNKQEGISFDGGAGQPTPQTSPKNKKPSFNASFVVPLSKRFVISAGVSRSWRSRPDNTPTETATWNLRDADSTTGAPKDIALAATQWDQIAQITVTENMQVGAEWRMAKNDTLSLSFQKRQVTTDRATNRFVTRFYMGTAYNPVGGADWSVAPNPEAASGGGGEFNMGANAAFNFREKTDNTHATLRYKHRDAKWHIDAQGVFSHAKRVKTNLGEGYFAGIYAFGNETMSPRKGYQLEGYGINSTDSILPTRYVAKNITTGETVNPLNGGDYLLYQVRDEDGMYKTDMYSGRADVTRIFSRHFQVKAGVAFSRMTKDDWQVPTTWSFNGDPSIGPATGANDRRLLKHYLADYPFLLAPGGSMNGSDVTWISPAGVYKLSKEHPEWFSQNASSTYELRAQRSKKMIEDIAAAYIRFDLRLFDNRLHAIGGVRYERTGLDGWSIKTDSTAIYVRDPETGLPLKNPDGTWQLITTNVDAQSRLIYQERAFHEGQSYGDFYPSLNLNYTFTDNLVLRAAYARTLGRPNISYVVNGITLPSLPTEAPDDDDDAGPTITVGNPALKPWTADSFHLSLDSYHLKGGFGSLGVYRKYVSNFFQRKSTAATREDLEHFGISGGDIDTMLAYRYGISRWINIGDARLTGLEFTYRQDLFFLPRWLQKIQVWINYTRMRLEGTNSRDFTGFAPETLSYGVNYIRPRFSLRFTAAYQAETKSALVSSTNQLGAATIPRGTYDYQDAYTRYGLVAEYAVSRAFALYVNWSDLIGDDRIKYRRADGTPAYAQNYQRTVTPAYIMVGVKGHF